MAQSTTIMPTQHGSTLFDLPYFAHEGEIGDFYVDDCLADGHEDDINWIFHLMDERFACKDAEWLDIESPLDYLGMDISQDDEFIYLSMAKYIDTALDLLGWTNIKPVSTPLREAIDPGPSKEVVFEGQSRRLSRLHSDSVREVELVDDRFQAAWHTWRHAPSIRSHHDTRCTCTVACGRH